MRIEYRRCKTVGFKYCFDSIDFKAELFESVLMKACRRGIISEELAELLVMTAECKLLTLDRINSRIKNEVHGLIMRG